MIYLSSFMLSNKQVKNPNIYPYNVFRGKYIEPFVFSPITVFYGNNGSGKSTLLNIIANKLQLKGKEYATSNSFGIVDYCNAFSNECSYSLGEDDFGFVIKQEEYIKFAQEKYSNGETSMQYFEEYLQPNALYLLDEPEVSLSPSVGTVRPEVSVGQKVNLYVNPNHPDEFYSPADKSAFVRKVFIGVGALCVSVALVLGVVLCMK